jgi:hypothetical protein
MTIGGTMKRLRVSNLLALPLEAITETFAVIAARGAGKSNTGAVMAEEMFSAGLPFVAIDPVGSWYGLRSAGDGKGAGLPIPIFGGKHGDVPLERRGGQLVADLVVDQRLTCVLDLSNFESESAKIEFLIGFARRLYAKNEAPLHLFLEEADDYIPQKPMREEAQLLRAWENIVRRGRARGLGVTMITQRSAVINKNVLTQAQTLIAMRTVGPQDIEAVEKWLKFHGQSREILATLAGLEDGEAWVWSPHFLKKTVRVRFRRRRTFDSGATPKLSKSASPVATLADIDVTKIAAAMADTIERAKADDPVHLKKRIRELEEAAKRAPRTTAKPAVADSRRADLLEKNVKALQEYSDGLFKGVALVQTIVLSLNKTLSGALGEFRQIHFPRQPKLAEIPALTASVPAAPQNPAPAPRAVAPREPVDNGDLSTGAWRVLTAVAQYADRGGIAKQQLKAITGYAGRTVENYVSILRVAGYVLPGYPMKPTPEGLVALGEFDPLPTGNDLREWWLRELEEGPRRILALLAEEEGVGLSKEEIIEKSSYAKRTVENHVSALRVRSLVYKHGGLFYVSKELFG